MLNCLRGSWILLGMLYLGRDTKVARTIQVDEEKKQYEIT